MSQPSSHGSAAIDRLLVAMVARCLLGHAKSHEERLEKVQFL
jgi:hypothetical protein